MQQPTEVQKKGNMDKAIIILGKELVRLGGVVFARYLATKNEETLKSFEAAEFMNSLFEGKLKTSDEEYLKPYLEPLWEINRAIEILTEANKETNA